MVNDLPLYRIELYDEADVEDIDSVGVDWDTPCITAYVKTQIPRRKSSAGGFDESMDPQVERDWRRLAEQCCRAVGSRISQLLEPCRTDIPETVCWHYGEYLDACEEIQWENVPCDILD